MAISTGFTKSCGARSGGVVTLWLADAADVSSFTLSGTSYSGVSMVGAAVFKKFEFDLDTCERKWASSNETKSLKIEHTVEFYMGKLTQTLRDRLQDIADSSNCGIIAICKDGNNIMWVEGYNQNFGKERPLMLKSDEGSSGKAFSDPTGATVILSSTDNEHSRSFTGTVPE